MPSSRRATRRLLAEIGASSGARSGARDAGLGVERVHGEGTADHRLRDVSVVILTGSREDSSLIELHRLGVLGYLVKPLTSQDFVRTVAGCISLTPST